MLIDRRPLAIPAYRRLWLASVVGAVGGSFAVVAVPVQLFTMTGSSATVGVAAVVSFIALAVASLSAGTLADTLDRRRLLLAAQGGLALTCVALWAQAALGGHSLAVLLVLVACQGLSLGAITSTAGAVVPRLVPADLLVAANSLSSLVRYAGSVVGPLLAGALIPLVGLGTLYLLDAVALVAVLWAVVRLPPIPPGVSQAGDAGQPDSVPGRVPGPAPGRRVRLGVSLRRLLDGFRYLTSHRVLVGVLAVDLAAMVFGMPVALFPELAERTYGGPPGGGPELGLLYAAYPAGVLLTGLASGTFSRVRRHGAFMAGAAVAWGGAVVLLGATAHLWVALLALVLGGGVNFALSTFRNAISQAYTDDAMRGRIQGSLTVVLFGGPQLANLAHGAAGAAYGPRLTIAVGGLLTVASVVGIVRLIPELWRYRPVEHAVRDSAI